MEEVPQWLLRGTRVTQRGRKYIKTPKQKSFYDVKGIKIPGIKY